MDVNTITQLVGALGFPIVCCFVMFYQNNKLQETLTELTKTLVSINERLSDVENTLKGGER